MDKPEPEDQPVQSSIPAARVAALDERRGEIRRQLAGAFPVGEARFLWEVGCGHGHFLNAYAAAHPDKICIGVDIASDRIARAVKKRDRAKLGHLHFIRTEARLFLEALPPEARITEVFILFPDPWPKARHHKHRILQTEFLAEVAARATPECRLYFRTDYHPYFAEAQAVVRESPHWQLLDAPWPFEFETVFQSRAESHDSFVATRRAVDNKRGSGE
ncbi:MAG: tRNA (guanosine(46)-N7)-methyltransferase TrmB [Verrucomicrobiota bacterium]